MPSEALLSCPTSTTPLHPTALDPSTLASSLSLAHLILSPPGSPPGSPPSSASRSLRDDSASDTSERLGARRPRRARSTSGSSGSVAGSWASSPHGITGHDLVMPGPNLEARPSLGTTRLLVVGRTEEERVQVVQLLTQLDSDLSSSQFDPTSSSSRRARRLEGLEPLGQTDNVLFFQPRGEASSEDVAELLQAHFHRIEKHLNPSLPTSQGLAEYVSSMLTSDCDVEACLFLFSSPPTLAEVAYARTISLAIPLLPVLLLPPPPRNDLKPQKTAALVRAVCDQLTVGGVRWVAASDIEPTSPPLFVLPHALFVESSGYSSLASSQELPPFESGRSMLASGGLVHLARLGNSERSQERLKWEKTISFLDWRAIELSARGQGRLIESDELESSARLGSRKRDQLAFSKRVGELRERLRATELDVDARYDELPDPVEQDSDDELSSGPSDLFSSQIFTDPTTPRCQPGQLGPSPPRTSPYFPIPSDPAPEARYVAMERGGEVFTDPMHLPSFFSLVGLNLRISLLPRPAKETDSSAGRRRWLNGAVTLAFFAGFLCGQISWTGLRTVVGYTRLL